jgi:hypothetical protein
MDKWSITSQRKKHATEYIEWKQWPMWRRNSQANREYREFFMMVEIDLHISVTNFDNTGSSAHKFAFLFLF